MSTPAPCEAGSVKRRIVHKRKLSIFNDAYINDMKYVYSLRHNQIKDLNENAPSSNDITNLISVPPSRYIISKLSI